VSLLKLCKGFFQAGGINECVPNSGNYQWHMTLTKPPDIRARFGQLYNGSPELARLDRKFEKFMLIQGRTS
jgi:hypothetical protein